ncbi:MAG: hypothetical protein NDI81_08690 [Desulfobacula sp.]|nr:hypothetical protein [Desulfobacula sp.]
MNDIIFPEKIGFRAAQKDEYWLQDQIWENPSILTLGDLQPINKEKKQSSGGKLDILLKDPRDNSMYEVEVMLGETDPSHIIRTIEYWDIERRRWPSRQHYAVLVAESISRRFFNVVQLLSLSIPLKALQVELLKIGNQLALNFVKVLDSYEEPDEQETVDEVDESYWVKHSFWTLDLARYFLEKLQIAFPNLELNCVKSYVAIWDGKRNLFGLHKRSNPRSLMIFNEKDVSTVEMIKGRFDQANIPYDYNKYSDFVVYLDKMIVSNNIELFIEIMKTRRGIASESEVS